LPHLDTQLISESNINARKAAKPQRECALNDIEELAKIAVDCGYHLHRELGPGLLESVYEILLEHSLIKRGLLVERQIAVPIRYEGIVIDNAFRADIIVEKKLIIELRSTETHIPVHAKQLLTYMRLLNLPLGLLMNFGTATFKEGVKRLVNRYKPE
jgi:GxxExxY protein